MTADAFDAATYYSCGDGEELEHQSPEDAICDLYHEATFEDIANTGPVTVLAFVRMQVSDKRRKMIAEHAIEDMREELSEYGEPGGDHIIEIGGEPLAIMRRAVDEIIDKHAHIWACEEVASREYSAEEIREMLR